MSDFLVDDVGVLFEAGDDLLVGRHQLPFEDAATGLPDHLPSQGGVVVQLRRQGHGAGIARALESLLDVLGPIDYPDCTHGCTAVSPRRVQFNFNGNHRKYLQSIQDLTTSAYDPFGNIRSLGGVNVPENSHTNRLTGSTYDAAGNITNYNGTLFEYDALGMVIKRTSSGSGERLFIYTADDERLWTYHWTGSRWTLRDLDGKVLRDYRSGTNGWSVERDYVHANGRLLAARNSAGTTYHYHPDHLGTPRLITNQFGNKMAYHAYYPYGKEATYWNQDSERMKFTGHERDFYDYGDGDDLDYQHARYYNLRTGRYLNVDPMKRYSPLSTPQSWNKFAYTLGNPLKYVDPNGQEAVVVIVGAGDIIQEKFGHAALWVERDGRNAGLSFGTPVQFESGLEDFVQQYLDQGRTVRSYFLGTTADQDKKMMDFINANSPVDEGRGFLEVNMVRENCAKAVCNALEAGGLLADTEDILGYLHLPFAVQMSLEAGTLQQYVKEVEYRKGKSKKRLTINGVQDRADPFAGTGFCSADGVCH